MAATMTLEQEMEAHRSALTGYCYRMIGSGSEAEDAVQETMVRAWRAADKLQARGALKAWLFKIANNVCLDMLQSAQRRAQPMDLGPAQDAGSPLGAPLVESAWVRPVADSAVIAADADPAEVAAERETLRLAFVAALQHLPPRQRAVLILREVLRWQASEVAELLETSVASVNSALQRARATVSHRAPARTQQATLRALGDRGLRHLVTRYVAAWERCDVDAFADLLAADATFAMPPLSTWYTPRDSVIGWARAFSLNGAWRWRALETRANAQPALGFYAWDDAAGGFLPFALNVLSLQGELVSDVTAFIVRATGAPEADAYVRFPDRPMDERQLAGTFARFGLPDRIG
jgi:RNA polymerase sigma-70 factor (ECF subfamily)